MTHRTQLYLDDVQYQYLKAQAEAEEKSIAQIIREWIEEKRNKRTTKKYLQDSFWKMRGIGSSGKKDIAEHFDDYLYGNKK